MICGIEYHLAEICNLHIKYQKIFPFNMPQYSLLFTLLFAKQSIRLPSDQIAPQVFFFKQKTAYEIMPSLVGSEMCIRDRSGKVGVNFLIILALNCLKTWQFSLICGMEHHLAEICNLHSKYQKYFHNVRCYPRCCLRNKVFVCQVNIFLKIFASFEYTSPLHAVQ